MDPAPKEENINLKKALRRANLLAAAAEVSQNITQILDIDKLLPKTVDIICDAYDFYYAGVFLIDEAGEYAVLRAGRGGPGRIMIENNHKLQVGGNSMIGACTALNEARISLDVDTEKVWYPNPVLPETRSEMALPLAIGDRVIGAVTVQSTAGAAFSDEDVSSLQAMANQLAIAIDNARKQRELVRAKTFEAIATATGDAIHWIGNKAEPIHGSVERIQYDLQLLVCAMADMLEQISPAQKNGHPLAQMVLKEAGSIQRENPELSDAAAKLNRLSPEKLGKRLNLTSVLEDLDIIDQAANLIMKVKEELIGPAREHAPRPAMVDDVVQDALTGVDIPRQIVSVTVEEGLPLVEADPVQLNRVFANLLKNAYEAMENEPNPQIEINLRSDEAGKLVLVDVADNGVGIPEADLDKIWITFHTTKGIRRHAGLGLPACRLILNQMGGQISAASQPGQGATFTVGIPITDRRSETTEEGGSGAGKILLIDDDDSWRQFAAATLQAGGYEVTGSGQNYQAGPYDRYDLIIVDDILVQGASLEIMEALKAAGSISKTLVFSSNPRVERTKERKILGIYDLAPKPYTGAGLLDQVRTALNAVR